MDPLLFKKFISHNTILPQIVLFLSKTMLIFSYILSTKTNTSFHINLKPKEIMYLNVSNRSHNSYDDVGVF
jgi:hypothetical protein